jgi:hypothetical protein
MSISNNLVHGMPMRLFMTALWILAAWGPIGADFNDTHLFNPDWMPHAKLHMMTVFTTSVALGIFGLYLVWGQTHSRPERLRLSAVPGLVYVIGLIVAAMTMPMYGGSLYWFDTEPSAAKLGDENLIVFLVTGAVFLTLTIVLYGAKDRDAA